MNANYPLWVIVGIWGSGGRKILILFTWGFAPFLCFEFRLRYLANHGRG